MTLQGFWKGRGKVATVRKILIQQKSLILPNLDKKFFQKEMLT